MADSVSLYSVLQIDQKATFDEIKSAFKRQALQVHPDKGGSKEAFHLVHQALEILADPDARKKYDQSVATARFHGTSPKPARVVPRRRTVSKQCDPGAKATHPRREEDSKRKTEGTAETAPRASQSQQVKLLEKIRDLLKQLPRDSRQEVIRTQFSQKQRLILERWMAGGVPCRGKQTHPLPSIRASRISGVTAVTGVQTFSEDRLKKGASMLALQDLEGELSKSRNKSRKGPKKKSTGSLRGYVASIRSSLRCCGYKAGICFDSVDMYTRQCDFQTALDFLVILTSVKQRMRISTAAGTEVGEALQSAIETAASEHGRDAADLQLRFSVYQASSFFMGSEFGLWTPRVRTVELLAKIRSCLEPFRAFRGLCGKGKTIFGRYSPVYLQDAWQRFQHAVADAWEIAGADSTIVLQRIRARYEARADFHNRQLRTWEQQHMAMQDRNYKHQPKRARARLSRAEHRELQQMQAEDPKFNNQQRAHEKAIARKLFILSKPLVRWGRVIRKESELAEKARRKIFRQQRKERRKEKENRRRLEALHQKRQREEERLRRERVRKRMRTDLTMDDILGRDR